MSGDDSIGRNMTALRITKRFDFEMAHVLQHHQGNCRFIHGHSYKLEVCVGGKINDNQNLPENGMLMDFGNLKELVTAKVLKDFDHALVINKNSPYQALSDKFPDQRLMQLEVEPTCENLLLEIVDRLKPFFRQQIKLLRITLQETSTSYAEWLAEDNHD